MPRLKRGEGADKCSISYLGSIVGHEEAVVVRKVRARDWSEVGAAIDE